MTVHDVSDVRVAGPLGLYADGFGRQLAGRGYRPGTVRRHMRLTAQVSEWLENRGLGPEGLETGAVREFFRQRRASGYQQLLTEKALEPLLGYLRANGIRVQASEEAEPSPEEILLARYVEYLSAERGVSAGRIRNTQSVVRPFLAGLGGTEPGRLTAGAVHEFLTAEAGRRSGKGAGCVVSALRSFLRFLYAQGIIASPLADAVPPVASWALAGLPRFLEEDQVRALLASCDTETAAGKRDLAVLTLLLRLGLRGFEAAALSLDDIDWRRGEIALRGKGNREDRLPVPADVGNVLAGYLADARPGTASGRTVFTRLWAPHAPLTAAGVRRIVHRAAARAGLDGVSAHRLRHTAATGMLRAGAPLAEISQVLRHSRPQTTAIYAKVDTEALRELAAPWPGTAA